MNKTTRFITTLLLTLCPLISQGDNAMSTNLTTAISNNSTKTDGQINPELISDETAATSVIQRRQVLKKIKGGQASGIQVLRPQTTAGHRKGGVRKIVAELKRQEEAGITDGVALGKILNNMEEEDKISDGKTVKKYLKTLAENERANFRYEVSEMKRSMRSSKTDWEAVGREVPEELIQSITQRLKSADPSLWN